MIFKIKTKKAALKRVKIKKNIYYRKKAYKAHLLRRKTKKQLRRLSTIYSLNKPNKKIFALMLT
jgi:ribosomal protein L35